MIIDLNKIRSVVEANLVAKNVSRYEYNPDGPNGVEGENLKNIEDLDAWITTKKIMYKDVQYEPSTYITNTDGTTTEIKGAPKYANYDAEGNGIGDPLPDTTSEIERIILFDNNTNLRDVIAQSILDVLSDTQSTGDGLSDPTQDPPVFGGGNKTEPTGNVIIELEDPAKTITIKNGSNLITVSSSGITITSGTNLITVNESGINIVGNITLQGTINEVSVESHTHGILDINSPPIETEAPTMP